MQSIIAPIVISLILGAVEKGVAQVNWDDVKKQGAQDVAKVIPNSWVDSELDAGLNVLVDTVAAGLKNEDDLKNLLDLVAGKDWNGAYDAVVQLIHDAWAGGAASHPAAVRLMSALTAAA